MKKINTLNVKQLRTEEDFGFLQQVSAETAYLPVEEGEDDRPVIESVNDDTPAVVSSVGATPALTTAKDNFKAALDTFDDALKDSAGLSAAAAATEADNLRDAAWRGANAYVKAMIAHPTEAASSAAVEVKSLFDKYGDPTSLSQTEESGVLHNLIQDLKALDSNKLTAAAFSPWLTNMETREENYLTSAQVRTEEEASRITGIVKQSRLAAEGAYRSLVEMVNALCLVNGEAPYATFIDHVNVLIDRQKTVLKSRSTKSAKKKEDDRPVIENNH